MIDAKMQERIAGVARKHGVMFAVLFGSAARGTSHHGSDIDIAVFSKKPLPLSVISEEMGTALGENNVEVADLSHASPFLMRAVAEDGTVLFESHQGVFSAWKVYARNVWFDTARLRARQKHSLQSWAKEYAPTYV